MPWTPRSFKGRHWKSASPSQAKRAARIANAMLKKGASEGVAIATGIARAKGRKKSR